MLPSSSGQGCRNLTPEIAGSNPNRCRVYPISASKRCAGRVDTTCVASPLLRDPDPGLLDHPPPLLVVAADPGIELLWSIDRRRHRAELLQAFDDRRLPDEGRERRGDLGADVGGDPRWNH